MVGADETASTAAAFPPSLPDRRAWRTRPLSRMPGALACSPQAFVSSCLRGYLFLHVAPGLLLAHPQSRPTSPRREPAVDAQLLTGHVGRRGRRQEHERPLEILG